MSRRKWKEAQEEAAEAKPRRRKVRRRTRSKIGDRRTLTDKDEGVLRLKGYTSGMQVPGQDPQTLVGSKRGMRVRGPTGRKR